MPNIFLSPEDRASNVYASGALWNGRATNEKEQMGRCADYPEIALKRCGFEVINAQYGNMYDRVSASNKWPADLHIALEGGLCLGALHIGQELLILIELAGIDKGVRLRHQAGEQVKAEVLLRGADVKAGVLRVIGGIPVIAQTCEHGAVIHVMAVDQGVLVAEVLGVLAVDKDGAVGVHLTAEQMVKIGEVVLSLGDGVVDHGVGAVNPAGGLRVLGLKSGKVNADGGDLHRLFLLLLLTGSGGGLGRAGGHKLLGERVVVLFRDFIASQGAYDLKGTEPKNAEKHHA